MPTWIDEAAESDRDSGQPRRERRQPIELMVRLRRGVTRSTVMLKDLTTRGARIEGIERMQIDEAVTIQLPELAPKLAFVCWSDGHSVGLEFDKPLCNEVFRDIVFVHGRREKEPASGPFRHAA